MRPLQRPSRAAGCIRDTPRRALACAEQQVYREPPLCWQDPSDPACFGAWPSPSRRGLSSPMRAPTRCCACAARATWRVRKCGPACTAGVYPCGAMAGPKRQGWAAPRQLCAVVCVQPYTAPWIAVGRTRWAAPIACQLAACPPTTGPADLIVDSLRPAERSGTAFRALAQPGAAVRMGLFNRDPVKAKMPDAEAPPDANGARVTCAPPSPISRRTPQCVLRHARHALRCARAAVHGTTRQRGAARRGAVVMHRRRSRRVPLSRTGHAP